MKNTLNDLNNHIFAALERLNDEDLTGEDLESEIKRSEAVSKLAESAVKAGAIQLKAYEIAQENGIKAEVPVTLIEAKEV